MPTLLKQTHIIGQTDYDPSGNVCTDHYMLELEGEVTTEELVALVRERFPEERCAHAHDCCGHYYHNNGVVVSSSTNASGNTDALVAYAAYQNV